MSVAPCANEADFVQLRVCQLRDACRERGLDATGKKNELAAKLAENGGFSQQEVLALRQTYQSGSSRLQGKKPVRLKTSAKKRKQKGPKIGDTDFRKLLWAVADGTLRCSCGKPLRHRNGRFGLFLFCASGHIERVEKAVARMQDLHRSGWGEFVKS
jgi:hypothetical protein